MFQPYEHVEEAYRGTSCFPPSPSSFSTASSSSRVKDLEEPFHLAIQEVFCQPRFAEFVWRRKLFPEEEEVEAEEGGEVQPSSSSTSLATPTYSPSSSFPSSPSFSTTPTYFVVSSSYSTSPSPYPSPLSTSSSFTSLPSYTQSQPLQNGYVTLLPSSYSYSTSTVHSSPSCSSSFSSLSSSSSFGGPQVETRNGTFSPTIPQSANLCSRSRSHRRATTPSELETFLTKRLREDSDTIFSHVAPTETGKKKQRIGNDLILSSPSSPSFVSMTENSSQVSSPSPKKRGRPKSQKQGDSFSPVTKERFIWGESAHEFFVEAVEMCGGVTVVTPSLILAHMKNRGCHNVTRENISSHLQKYKQKLQKNTPLVEQVEVSVSVPQP